MSRSSSEREGNRDIKQREKHVGEKLRGMEKYSVFRQRFRVCCGSSLCHLETPQSSMNWLTEHRLRGQTNLGFNLISVFY